MGVHILLVEDEKEIADLIELYLISEGFKVFKFDCAKDALMCIEQEKIDLAILDVMLPDEDGFYICKQIREKYTFPVMILTAKEEEMDKIMGLTLGADDYMTKPFRPLELVARVKAQIRRYTKYNTITTESEDILTYDGLMIDLKKYECTLDGQTLSLTPTEFSILKILCEQKGKVVGSEQLFHEIWGDEYFQKSYNTIATHIRHLREKMRDSTECPKYIQTVWGVGYRLGK